MNEVRLLHWNLAEVDERLERLRVAGFKARTVPLPIPVAFRHLRESPPSAIVIDLSRLPSAGRDVGLSLRTYKATRQVPIVFVGGDPEKVSHIKRFLPDAFYASWDDIGSSLRRAIANPPSQPVVPRSRLEGYSSASLPKKLGIKRGSLVCLIDAPLEFEKTLGKLPKDVTIHKGSHPRADVAVWFVHSRKDLETRIKQFTFLASKGAFWIAWPKKASQESSDLSLNAVRKAGVGAGMMDFKVSSFNAVWSGLRFTSRHSRA